MPTHSELAHAVHVEGENLSQLRVLSLVSQICALAERLDLRPPGSNPTRAIRAYRENKRTVFLAVNERRRFVDGAREAVLRGEASAPAAGCLLLQLLAGLRSSEARHLRWCDVRWEDDEALVTIPRRDDRGRRKNKGGDERVIPLSAAAAAVVRHMPRWCEYVFAARSTGLPYTDLRKPLAAICRRAGVKPLTPHALRHSYGTACAEAGLTPDEIAACLGHRGRASAERYVHLAGRAALGAARRAARAAGG